MDPKYDLPAESEDDRPIRTLYIGVDPGLTGAVAVCYRDMVLLVDVKKLSEGVVNGVRLAKDVTLAMRRIIEEKHIHRDYIRVVMTIEDVRAFPGSSAGATFTFGRALGSIESAVMFAIVAMKIPYEMRRVRPQVWKAKYELLRTMKTESVAKACEVAKNVHFRRHDQAEAYLMAMY